MAFPIPDIGRRCRTAVEISKNYLKIAEAEVSARQAVISKLITEPILGLSDAEVSKAFSDIVSANNIRTDSITAVIPRERVMVRYIRLPSLSPDEIENMISFEAAKQIPYSADEIISDHRVIGVDAEGYSEIILAVMHKKEAERINAVVSSAAKGAQRIVFSSEAISAMMNFAAKQELAGKNACIIDIDTSSTDITVINDRVFVFGRSCPVGAANISPDEVQSPEWQKRLIDQIQNSIGVYIKEKQKSAADITDFIVTGAGSVAENFSSLLQQEMEVSCRYFNLLSLIPLSDTALTEKGVAVDASCSAVCGSLFIEESINLIPAELKSVQRAQRKIRNVIILSAGITLILASLLSAAFSALYQKKRLLARMESMLKGVEPQAKVCREKLERLRLIKENFTEGATSLDVLYTLYKLVPDNISLIDFDYEQASRVLRFRGTTQRMSDVFSFANILEKSERFSNVQARSVAKRRTREGEVVDFQISCSFNVQGEE